MIGADVSEMLDVVPAMLRVKRIHRPRYGCRSCEGAVVQAKAPPRPVDGGLPTPALLVHVAVMKFACHTPLNRQAQILAGQGIVLDRSTLVHWVARLAWWLRPLHELLRSIVLSALKPCGCPRPWLSPRMFTRWSLYLMAPAVSSLPPRRLEMISLTRRGVDLGERSQPVAQERDRF